MQIQTTMICHYMSTRYLKLKRKNTDNTNFDYVMQLKHSYIVFVIMQNGTGTFKN